jgi:hypothetical protein
MASNPVPEAFTKVYETVDEAKAARGDTKGVRPYLVTFGRETGYVIGKNQEIAVRRFFDAKGGKVETVSTKGVRVSRTALNQQKEALERLLPLMTGKTKDAVAQRETVEKQLKDITEQIEKAQAAKAANGSSSSAPPPEVPETTGAETAPETAQEAPPEPPAPAEPPAPTEPSPPVPAPTPAPAPAPTPAPAPAPPIPVPPTPAG